MVILPYVLDDSRRKVLTEARAEARRRAFERFQAALSLVEAGEPDPAAISRDGLLYLPLSALNDALQSVPAGGDRRLVREAVGRGVHRLAAVGLHIAHPQDLLEELCAAGAYNCLLVPETMYWPLPDQQRVANLIESLPAPDL